METTKLQIIGSFGSDITVDAELSSTSANPIQNQAVAVAINELNSLVGDTTVANQISQQIVGKADVSHSHSANDITSGVVPIVRGGIGSSDGAEGLKNLFSSGKTVISANQYGENLPSSASEGTLFFKKTTGSISDMNQSLLNELKNEITEPIYTELDGKSDSGHKHGAGDITSGSLAVGRGGTGSTNGATGLKNLLAAGAMVLSSHQYGTSLPTAGTAGRIFFKKV